MKKIILGLMVISLLLLTACAEEVSDEDIKEDLSELSDEELDSVIEEAGSKDIATVGEAFLSRKGYTWARRVPREKLLIIAQELKIERLERGIERPPPDDQIGSGIEVPDEAEGASVIETPGETEGFNPKPEPSAIE